MHKFVLLLCFFALVQAHAASSVIRVAAQADAIVVGSVASATITGDRVAFDVNVDRVLKGDAFLRSVHVNHMWTRRISPFDGSEAQQFSGKLYGMWCLQRGDSTGWEIIEVNLPGGTLTSLGFAALPSPPVAYPISESTSVVDRVAFEIASGVESNANRPGDILVALGSLNTTAAQMILSRFVASPKITFQSAGLRGMLERGGPDSVTQLMKLWPAVSTNKTARWEVLGTLRDDFRDPTPQSVELLIQLAEANSTTSDLRSAAVRALSSIHTRETLPFLASLLLSSDPAEQGRGVFGLASFANGCPSQTPSNVKSMEYLRCALPSPYRTKETLATFGLSGPPRDAQDNIAFWTSWWNTNKPALGFK